ncbi:MAG: CpaD family pilus assembly lipoprotein [Hellea sp.]|nr:CpaD family pilus assembly lipoprotein [Hellea sp.]
MKYSPKSFKASVLTGLSLAILAGCASPMESQPPTLMRHPIQVAESIERLELYARPDGMSLSARDQHAVAGFLEGYARYGEGPLHMSVPNHSNAGTAQTTSMVREMMSGMGLGGNAVQEGQHQAAAQFSPVVVSYRRLKALPRDCSINANLANTYSNQPYPNFGCSQSANLAAMIDDPAQLLAPNEMGPANMRRRMTVYDKYIKGENPASALPNRQEISSSDNTD